MTGAPDARKPGYPIRRLLLAKMSKRKLKITSNMPTACYSTMTWCLSTYRERENPQTSVSLHGKFIFVKRPAQSVQLCEQFGYQKADGNRTLPVLRER